MRKIILAMAALAAGTMQGALIDLTTSGIGTFTGGSSAIGNSFKVVDLGSGITLTITAFATGTASTSNYTSAFGAAAVRQWGSSGLGICNAYEIATPTSSPACTTSNPTEHAADNVGEYEMFKFQFTNTATNALVTVSNIKVTFGWVSGDWDSSFWLGNNIDVNGKTFATLEGLGVGGYGPATNISGVASPYEHLLGSGSGNTLLFGPRLGGYDLDDVFKVKSIAFDVPTITTTGDGVPEPATYALMGAALLGLGYMRRKKA